MGLWFTLYITWLIIHVFLVPFIAYKGLKRWGGEVDVLFADTNTGGAEE